MIKYNCNVCDRIYNEVMVHFTKNCPNNCPWCVDKENIGVGSKKPNVDKIYETILKYSEYIDTVNISGGEPFLYMEELYDLVARIRNNTSLKINVITAIPKNCYSEEDNLKLFYKICNLVDNIQFSAQHYDERIASKMLLSEYPIEQKKNLYIRFPYKNKVTISINVVKGFMETKEDILKAIIYYNKLGYKNIKIAEMFDADDWYIDIPKAFGIKMKSPYSHGCKVEYDIKKLLPKFDGTLIIKRTCFYRTKCQEASLCDLIKVLTKYIKKKKYFFGVIHEDGTIAPYWI